MNAADLEITRGQLLQVLIEELSPRYKLFSITEFIQDLDKINNKNIFESYIAEFIDEYIALLKLYNPSGLEPSKTELIINTMRKIEEYGVFGSYQSEFIRIKNSLSKKLEELKAILSGEESSATEHLYFPVLEHNARENSKTGFLEFLDIKINKVSGKSEDVFFIIPSREQIEKRLNEQIKNSWMEAKKFLREKSVKITQSHEIVISFNGKYGEYVGNSLGLVLTIGFIEKLVQLYQTKDIIKIKACVAMTGGIDKEGVISPLPEEIISAKVEVAFYSNVKFLVVPQENKEYAEKILDSLKIKFPKRDLVIIGASNLDDILRQKKNYRYKKTAINNTSCQVQRKTLGKYIFAGYTNNSFVGIRNAGFGYKSGTGRFQRKYGKYREQERQGALD